MLILFISLSSLMQLFINNKNEQIELIQANGYAQLTRINGRRKKATTIQIDAKLIWITTAKKNLSCFVIEKQEISRSFYFHWYDIYLNEQEKNTHKRGMLLLLFCCFLRSFWVHLNTHFWYKFNEHCLLLFQSSYCISSSAFMGDNYVRWHSTRAPPKNKIWENQPKKLKKTYKLNKYGGRKNGPQSIAK